MSDLHASQHTVAAQSQYPVLVVDDDQYIAGFLVHMLRNEGMNAVAAADGRAALARIMVSPPDVVMLDVQISGPNGFDIGRQWGRHFEIATGVGNSNCGIEAIVCHTVNTAARLVQMAAANEVPVCSNQFLEVVQGLAPERHVASRGKVALRGGSEPTPVFASRDRG
jgi:CheY-like chemotaxis protein